MSRSTTSGRYDLSDRDRLRAIVGRADIMAQELEQPGEPFGGVGVVINHKDTGGMLSVPAGRAGLRPFNAGTRRGRQPNGEFASFPDSFARCRDASLMHFNEAFHEREANA